MPENNENTLYPHVGFTFKVSFEGLEGGDEVNGRFQSVEGLKMSMSPTMWKEGGENRYEHSLIGRPKYGPLVLKRGLFQNATLYNWYANAFETMEVQPLNLTISLLGEGDDPLITWEVTHAIPTDWDISSFDASKSEIVVESMKMNYRYFKRQD